MEERHKRSLQRGEGEREREGVRGCEGARVREGESERGTHHSCMERKMRSGRGRSESSIRAAPSIAAWCRWKAIDPNSRMTTCSVVGRWEKRHGSAFWAGVASRAELLIWWRAWG
jgi:hypothetical protein